MGKKVKQQAVNKMRVERRKTAQRERHGRDDAAQAGKIRVTYEVGDLGEVLRHLVRLYPGPLAGLNEVVSNGGDAYRESKIEGGRINIHVRRKPQFAVTVEDFSQGVPRRDLIDLPKRVAASEKRKLDDPTIVGSKGIGLFGSLAVGARARICSRHNGAKDTWALNLDYDGLSEGAEVELETTSPLALAGTRVVITDVPETNQKALTPQRIARYLAEQKREALRAGLYRILVIDDDKSEQVEVQPALFKGRPMGVHRVRTPHGAVQFDLYVHPTPGDHHVEVIGRGGNRLLEDLGSISAFKNDVWASGQVEGTITDQSLEPTTGRTGIYQDRKSYPVFVGVVRKYEADVRREVDRHRQEAAQKLAGKINEALRKIYQQVLAELPEEIAFPTKTAIVHASGEELEGTPSWDQGEAPDATVRRREDSTRDKNVDTQPAIDRTVAGKTRGKWRSFPTWYPDNVMPPDGPRSRFAEAAGAIYLNSQHDDYLAVMADRDKGDGRPLLVYLIGLLWKEYLAVVDPFDERKRQADDLVGYITKSQKYIPARI